MRDFVNIVAIGVVSAVVALAVTQLTMEYVVAIHWPAPLIALTAVVVPLAFVWVIASIAVHSMRK